MATILVVDDEISIRTALRQVLEHVGFVVWDAPDGSAAMHLIRDTSVDLVITDIMMPEQDGLEMISQLRISRPEVKIIAISGGGRYSLPEFLQVAQLIGAKRAFEKPVSPRELLVAVWELLGNR